MDDKEQTTLVNDLIVKGYTILQGDAKKARAWKSLLAQYSTQLNNLCSTWNKLPPDDFLSDGGHYRYRRYSVFNWLMAEEKLILLPHEPHFQSTYRNNMNGGINRDFEPFLEPTLSNPILPVIIKFVAQQITFKQQKEWRIQAHQFRIEANSEEAGLPTPEGIHRDGADYILIMLLNRENIRGGVNHIYDDAKRLVFGAVLENKGDAIIIDDQMVWHGVSEVYPDDNSKPSHRDVLVLTFHNETELEKLDA